MTSHRRCAVAELDGYVVALQPVGDGCCRGPSRACVGDPRRDDRERGDSRVQAADLLGDFRRVRRDACPQLWGDGLDLARRELRVGERQVCASGTAERRVGAPWATTLARSDGRQSVASPAAPFDLRPGVGAVAAGAVRARGELAGVAGRGVAGPLACGAAVRVAGSAGRGQDRERERERSRAPLRPGVL